MFKKVLAVVAGVLILASCVSTENSGQTNAPEPCLLALQLADEAFRSNSVGYEGVGEVLDGNIYSGNAKITHALNRLEEITPEYNKAKNECRNLGQ